MIIKNGRVFQEDGTFAEKDIYIEGKRFVSTKEEVIDQEVIDAKGMMVLPGLVDADRSKIMCKCLVADLCNLSFGCVCF